MHARRHWAASSLVRAHDSENCREVSATVFADLRYGISIDDRRTAALKDAICARLRRTSEQVQELTFLNLTSSLAKALLQLTDKAQALKSTPKVTITQREISQIIGRSREGTNKQLRVWAKQGLLRLEPGAVTVLRRDKLVEVAARALGLDPS
jgi:hypothetical protein